MRTAEEKREYLRAYNKANKERIAAKKKEWLALNPEKRRAISNKWARANAEYRRRHKLMSRYGITLEQFDALRAEQDYKCAICERPESESFRGQLVVDHMHCSGKVRSLLCHHCNAGIGMLQDNPDVLYAAAKYVLKHRRQLH